MNLSFFNPLYFFVLLWFHCLIGGIATLIAQKKGYSAKRWLLIGLIGGTPAFFYALWLKSKND